MFGTVFTGLAVGMLIGPRILPSYSRSRVFGLSIGSAGVALLAMSVIRNFILALGFAGIVGASAGMAWIIGYTLIGQEVEDRLRGRTFAFVLSSVRIVLLLSVLVGSQLAGPARVARDPGRPRVAPAVLRPRPDVAHRRRPGARR